jgi:hypothetical protein
MTLVDLRKLLLAARNAAEAAKHEGARKMARAAFQHAALGDNTNAAGCARRAIRLGRENG